MSWVRCRQEHCRKVYDDSLLHTCPAPPRATAAPTSRKISTNRNADAVARYRATPQGQDYTRKYNQAVKLATKRMKEEHPLDWELYLAWARQQVGL